MATVSAFQPATPAMIVGHGKGDEPLPLDLAEPFALLGGDRLGPDGIPFMMMHEHQPDLLGWVRARCTAMLAAERPWFNGGTLILDGVAGAGRTHAARWLARVVGVPHAVINLTNPVIAANIAASSEIGEALGASPLTIAMAAGRCANPVATVIGADRVNEDVLAGLAVMMDPERCRRWREDRLGVDIDLGEVTWILQRDSGRHVPSWIAPDAHAVKLRAIRWSTDHELALSICLEAMGDLNIDPHDGTWSWRRISEQLPQARATTAKELYANMIDALRACQRQPAPSIDHEPF